MSITLLPYINCPDLQARLNDIATKNPQEPAPEVAFLTSDINTGRILETAVAPGSGKIRRVQVVYTPRLLEDNVSTTVTSSCNAGDNAGELSETYDIDETEGVQHSEEIVIGDLVRRCQSNPDYLAERVAAILNGVVRKMQTEVAEQMAALAIVSKFAHDNGDNAYLSLSNTLKTIATRDADGKYDPEALAQIAYSAINSGFKSEIPYVFGYGEVWFYMNQMMAAAPNSAQGLDFAKYVGQNQVAFLASQKMHKALNASSGNKFIAVDPGSLFLLQYNRFEDEANQVNDGMHQQGIIVDPVTGVPFNYKFNRSCDEKAKIFISTAFKVVALPDDMYEIGDRLYGTRGLLTFDIDNA